MKPIKQIVAIVFCMAMSLILCAGVGSTQARYENKEVWRGVYTPVETQIQANLLSEQGDQVVLTNWQLNPQALQTQRSCRIQIRTSGGVAEGSFSCKVESAADYLTAGLYGTVEMVSDQTVTAQATGQIEAADQTSAAAVLTETYTGEVQGRQVLLSEEELNLDLTITLTEATIKLLHQESGNPAVSSGDAGSVSDGDVDSKAAAGTLTAVSSGDAAAFPVQSVISVHWTPTGETQPRLWARFVIQLVKTESRPEVSGNDVSNEVTVLSTTDPAITDYTQSFHWDDWFGLKVSLPEGTDTMELQYNGMYFPAGTKYRVDHGPVMILGESQNIQIFRNTQNAGEHTILLRMDQTAAADKAEPITVSAIALDGNGGELGFDYKSLTIVQEPFAIDTTDTLPLIEKDGVLILPSILREEEVTWYVEYLTEEEDTTQAYKTTEDSYGLEVRFGQLMKDVQQAADQRTDAAGQANAAGRQADTVAQIAADASVLTISNKKALAPAGSYRLVIKKLFAGTEIQEFKLPFFIHY